MPPAAAPLTAFDAPEAIPSTPQEPLLVADLRRQGYPRDEMIARFLRDGYVHLRGLIAPTEVAALQAETWPLIEQARQFMPARPSGMDAQAYATFVDAYVQQTCHGLPPFMRDLYTAVHPASGTVMPRAIDHIGHHAITARALLGHPDLLSVVEAMQGDQFITTASPMVFKYPERGAIMCWHRDALRPKDAPEAIPTFTADLYLDATTPENAVWAVPGSHRLSPQEALDDCIRRNDGMGFKTDGGAVPIIAEPGDLVLHHTWVNHGSASCDAPLRRIIYFQFLPMQFARRMFNHTYLRHSHRRIAMSIAERMGQSYAKDETPYRYRTNVSFADRPDPAWRDLPPFRVPFWFYRADGG
jgi:hypothetical protein